VILNQNSTETQHTETSNTETSNTSPTPDTLVFSTFQTAILKSLASKIQDIDLIIIDESHNIKSDEEYANLLAELEACGRNGYAPMIVAVTATPNEHTFKLF
jgi:superfamily II DNA or RNA helicase